MSLILEALQRADQERRDTGEVPGIDADHISREPPTTVITESISSRIYVPLLLGLVVALGIYIIYLQRPAPTPQINRTPTASTIVAEPIAETDTIQARNPGPTREAAAFDTRIDTEADRLTPGEIAALYEQAAKQQSELIDYAQIGSADEISESSALQESRQNAESSNSISYTSSPEDSADSVYLSLPFASQLAEHQQRSIPAIRYTTHGYDPQTGRGRVTLNGRTYRRGDSVIGGLILIDIRADYIVLDMNGTLFRLNAATDWSP